MLQFFFTSFVLGVSLFSNEHPVRDVSSLNQLTTARNCLDLSLFIQLKSMVSDWEPRKNGEEVWKDEQFSIIFNALCCNHTLIEQSTGQFAFDIFANMISKKTMLREYLSKLETIRNDGRRWRPAIDIEKDRQIEEDLIDQQELALSEKLKVIFGGLPESQTCKLVGDLRQGGLNLQLILNATTTTEKKLYLLHALRGGEDADMSTLFGGFRPSVEAIRGLTDEMITSAVVAADGCFGRLVVSNGSLQMYQFDRAYNDLELLVAIINENRDQAERIRRGIPQNFWDVCRNTVSHGYMFGYYRCDAISFECLETQDLRDFKALFVILLSGNEDFAMVKNVFLSAASRNDRAQALRSVGWFKSFVQM